MAINSDTLIDLVNQLREQIRAETDTGEDALAVCAFLALTFAVDAKPDRALDDTAKAVVIEAVDWAFDQARELGFALKTH